MRAAYPVSTYVATAAGESTMPRMIASLASSSFVIASPAEYHRLRAKSPLTSAFLGRALPNHGTYLRTTHQNESPSKAANTICAAAAPTRPKPRAIPPATSAPPTTSSPACRPMRL